MPESFNSPRQAISFLKRRGLYKETIASSIHVEYVELNRRVTDPHDIEACRYLIHKDYLTTYHRNLYNP